MKIREGKREMSILKEMYRGLDQVSVWGTDRTGRQYPSLECFVNSDGWSTVREIYLKIYPDVMHITLDVAIPDPSLMGN